MSKRKSIIWQMPSNDFKILVKNSNSYVDILKVFYSNPFAGNYKTLKKRIVEENIDISHIETHKYYGGINNSIPLEEILIENSTYENRTKLKKRLIESGLLENKCYECGINPEWNNKPLSLQLEHKNGISNDNRLENLSILCPNCHSQTPTFAGKNANKKKNITKNNIIKNKQVVLKDKQKILKDKQKITCKICDVTITKKSNSGLCKKCINIENGKKKRKIPIIKKNELKQLIRNKSFVEIGKMFNVSDNTIRKWCKKYNLPFRTSEIKQYTDNEWNMI